MSREPRDGMRWALVNRPIADLMSHPSVSSERLSQCLLGEACRLLRYDGDWAEIQLERDGYVGWTHTPALFETTEETSREYLAAAHTVVSAEIAQAYLSAEHDAFAGKLPLGLRLPLADRGPRCVAVRLPDGRVWWLDESDVMLDAALPQSDLVGVARALLLMKRCIGVPYLWGGRTPFGFDCSGLAQLFCSLLGVSIPRDADQQFQAGSAVDGPAATGDLIFFRFVGGPNESVRHADVRHVAISLGGDEILHANAKVRSVEVDRLVRDGDSYGAWLLEAVAGVRRFAR